MLPICELVSDTSRQYVLVKVKVKIALEQATKTQRGGNGIAVVYFLLVNSPASEFYMPTFRNILSVSSS
jgi:hypothetical protein